MSYMDHNATTAPAPEVIDAMVAVLSATWANASSQHEAGQQARRRLAAARAAIAGRLGCRTSEIVFTSGATEANHLAIRGLLAVAAPQRRRVVASAIEHAGHLELLRTLTADGVAIDLIDVRRDGMLDLEHARRLMGADVALVSVMAANNETGALMPIPQVSDLAHAAGALMHVDATQFIGKLPFDFATLGVDAATLSAHKFHGPKGIGALLLRQGTALRPQICGSQERRRRGGTENLPAIAGMATALERLHDIGREAARLTALRDRLERGLEQRLPATHVFAQALPRLPGTSYLRFGHLPADLVLQRLETLGVAASSGAACSSGGSDPSHVLTAMGVDRDTALCAIRLSLGEATSVQDVDQLLDRLPPLLMPLLDARRQPA